MSLTCDICGFRLKPEGFDKNKKPAILFYQCARKKCHMKYGFHALVSSKDYSKIKSNFFVSYNEEYFYVENNYETNKSTISIDKYEYGWRVKQIITEVNCLITKPKKLKLYLIFS